ncbi:hypothetical protein [Roseateles aquatilis]|uniref:hypothetical protein n=1 Tax=Roseateles aquatilis TaxID=431061 RepID=UPI001131FA4D|nr:hypothetical protein [Roseateles aquatilis]
MPEILNSSETLLEKRACVATLMDEHPEIFARPNQHSTWVEFAQQNKTPDDHEQRIIDQATGRIHQVMRAAQDRTPPQFDMKEMLNTVRDQGIGDFEADPRVLEIASPDATADDDGPRDDALQGSHQDWRCQWWRVERNARRRLWRTAGGDPLHARVGGHGQAHRPDRPASRDAARLRERPPHAIASTSHTCRRRRDHHG